MANGHQISPLRDEHVESLCALAREIWLQHYPGIITVKQIEYMLAQRYSPDAIRAQLRDRAASWDVLESAGELCGFVSCEPGSDARTMKLDKLYVHQIFRGKGFGAALVDHVANAARREGRATLYLQVNKYNHGSVEAYKRMGFTITRSLKVDIGQGFLMDDYVMSLAL
ncbi:MAG: GNAT family N-acetyltransferase [Betaproteobacteria bacterium]